MARQPLRRIARIGRLVVLHDIGAANPVNITLVEKTREFTLVPWRPALERQLGKPIAGIMRGNEINWQFGRGRGGPIIS